MAPTRIALIALLVSLAGGCFEKEGWAPTTDDKQRISENILEAVPAMKFKVNAELEDRVTYLGLDVDREVVRPGEAVRLTHYWRVHKPIPNWKLFVHLIGPGAYVNADHKPVDGLYPVSQWKAGQIIRDRHTASVPANYGSDEITVRVGLWRGKERMKIKGPQDEEDRVLAATLKVVR
jgi:hypothetical protein